ncbi:DUF4395 domain-containing protein [Microbacterium sp. HJ5]
MSERADAPAPRGIDPRGPRFVAGVTALLLLIDVFLGLTGLSTAHVSAGDAEAAFGWFAYQPLADESFVPLGWAITYASVAARVLDPAFLLLLTIALLFLWGVLSPRTAPWAVLYRSAVAPRLSPPSELEDPRPPRFAQGVGLIVATMGLLLQLFGVPWALTIAAMMAFIAAFLNAVFGLCLGCQLYLLLQRLGLIGRARPAAA